MSVGILMKSGKNYVAFSANNQLTNQSVIKHIILYEKIRV